MLLALLPALIALLPTLQFIQSEIPLSLLPVPQSVHLSFYLLALLAILYSAVSGLSSHLRYLLVNHHVVAVALMTVHTQQISRAHFTLFYWCISRNYSSVSLVLLY
eukprot:scpid73474/ scgid26461/ 